jgi:hypothetical protein
MTKMSETNPVPTVTTAVPPAPSGGEGVASQDDVAAAAAHVKAWASDELAAGKAAVVSPDGAIAEMKAWVEDQLEAAHKRFDALEAKMVSAMKTPPAAPVPVAPPVPPSAPATDGA